jgi:hypothetical protein
MSSPRRRPAFASHLALAPSHTAATRATCFSRPLLPRRRPHRAAAAARPQASASASPQPAPPLKIYERYLTDIAKSTPPPYLDAALHVLTVAQGQTPAPPHARAALHPFVIPLATSAAGATTGLLRWPTPPPGMQLPVVRCPPRSLAVELLANSCHDFVTRALAAADYGGRPDEAAAIRAASSLALAYQDGAVETAGVGLERYLLMHVAPFPDVYEGLARFHLAKKDERSGLVTCERHAAVFPGWARAQVFHADVLVDLGRPAEARDAARFGLQMPLWTAGGADAVRRLALVAGYVEEDSLGKIYRRLYEDERESEIADGKAKEQVALDRAAYLLDVRVAEGAPGGWEEDVCEGLAELYADAGLADVATFIRMGY